MKRSVSTSEQNVSATAEEDTSPEHDHEQQKNMWTIIYDK